MDRISLALLLAVLIAGAVAVVILMELAMRRRVRALAAERQRRAARDPYAQALATVSRSHLDMLIQSMNGAETPARWYQ